MNKFIAISCRKLFICRITIQQILDGERMKGIQTVLDIFTMAVKEEKIALEKQRLADEAVKESADAYLAALGENDRPRPIYVPPNEILGKIKSKKGN